MKTFTFI